MRNSINKSTITKCTSCFSTQFLIPFERKITWKFTKLTNTKFSVHFVCAENIRKKQDQHMFKGEKL